MKLLKRRPSEQLEAIAIMSQSGPWHRTRLRGVESGREFVKMHCWEFTNPDPAGRYRVQWGVEDDS